MTVTFTQARAIVGEILARDWPASAGTLMVSAEGSEDETHFLVVAGARESLEDDDLDFLIMDAPAYRVDKATGGLTEAVVIESFARLERMTPVRDLL